MRARRADTGTTVAPPRTRFAAAAAAPWAVFLVATSLRPAITSVGPLLPTIGDATGLSESQLGLLGALPLIAFAGVSPLVHRLSRAFGAQRCVLAALLLLALGCIVRSAGGIGGLWLGTLVIGTAVAVGNVLVPVLVKREYASRISRATSVYTACITIFAALAAVVAVPLASATGWRFALAIWAVQALIIAAVWWPRARAAAGDRDDGDVPHDRHPSVWRQPTAWLLTAFMGLQSTAFYVFVTWLPTIEISTGVPAREAGVHLFLFQLAGLAGGLSIPFLLRRPTSQITGAVVSCLPMLVSVLGLLAAPDLVLVWALIAGVGQGATLVVALTLIGVRGRTPHETTQLSGMAQSVGYLLAAAGPVAAGVLTEHTGNWDAALVMMAVLAIVQIGVAVGAGRDRRPPLPA
jgi:CP family cyanate transporter-like MFS transporter